MKNNKLLVTVLIIITTIALLGTTALVVVMKIKGSENETVKEPTIDKIVESSVDVPEITTNLLGGEYVRIQFKIHTENKKAKEELEKRDFQVRNIIIQELSEMRSEQFQGKEGIGNLEDVIKKQVNELMQEGNVIQVYTTAFVLQ